VAESGRASGARICARFWRACALILSLERRRSRFDPPRPSSPTTIKKSSPNCCNPLTQSQNRTRRQNEKQRWCRSTRAANRPKLDFLPELGVEVFRANVRVASFIQSLGPLKDLEVDIEEVRSRSEECLDWETSPFEEFAENPPAANLRPVGKGRPPKPSADGRLRRSSKPERIPLPAGAGRNP